MKIAVLGTGNVGGALGARWAQKGHEVLFGSRQPESERVQQLLDKAGKNARAMTIRQAAEQAELVVLATPWPTAQNVLEQAGDLEGKILIDTLNPLNADFTGLDLGHTTSAGEQVARWARGARVVKAFNTVSASAMANPVFDDQPASMFLCGDDADAKATVRDLAEQLGFQTFDAGPLPAARYLEPMAMLYIQVAIKEGWGGNCAFTIMKR